MRIKWKPMKIKQSDILCNEKRTEYQNLFLNIYAFAISILLYV